MKNKPSKETAEKFIKAMQKAKKIADPKLIKVTIKRKKA